MIPDDTKKRIDSFQDLLVEVIPFGEETLHTLWDDTTKPHPCWCNPTCEYANEENNSEAWAHKARH